MGDKFVMSRIHRGPIDRDRSFLREFFPRNFSKRIYSRHFCRVAVLWYCI